jgi:tetratricopeptide (TPR) repeat protein
LLIEANQLLQTTSALRMRGNLEGSLDVGAKANALVEQALAIDPESAMALEQKARIVSLEATPELFEQKLSAFDRRTRSAEYLRRALAADPDYAPALAALGEYYRRYEWRWSTAGAMLARSVALDPNLVDARVSYSYFLSGVGRCVEALEEAQTALEIDPEFGWRSMGVPRALKCLGRFDDAEKAYLDMLRQDPDNVMVLRELYLGHLVRGDADGLEALRAHLRDDVWKGVPSPDGQGWLDWTGHAVRAMRGNKEQFASMLETQLRKIVGTGAEGDGQSLKDALRGKAELMWVLAVEFAFTGNTDQAIEMLQGAVQGGSLYIPETMPAGQFEFTPEMRADPRYQAIWRNDSRLVELVNLRRQAIADGQMAGPGRPVVDKRS